MRCVPSVSMRSSCESHETVFGVHEGGVVIVDAFSFGGGLFVVVVAILWWWVVVGGGVFRYGFHFF